MKLLTIKETAELLRLCPQSVRNLCDEKKIACIRHRPNGKRLIPRESVEKYLSTLTDSVEMFAPAVVAFDDVGERMKARSERIRRVK